MAYCDMSDVQELMGITFGASTRPTSTAVEEFIDDIAATLDGYIQAAGYDVPVTETEAVKLLKSMNRFGAACTAWHTGYISDVPMPRAEFWCGRYTRFEKDLRDGKVQLPGLEPESDLDPVFNIVQSPPRDRYWTGDDEPLESS